MKKIKVGVCGIGQFAPCFVPLFKVHPLVDEVVLCEKDPDRLKKATERFGVRRTVQTFDELCRSDVDAVAIFTQRWTHAPLAIKALEAGKHVYSAVPAAVTLEEMEQLIEVVKRTGLTYMLGETSYYYPSTIYCRERFKKGDMGRFVYGEGEYYHDMSHGFYKAFQYSGGDDWIKQASFPPMLYPTHSVSMILSVTGARMTHVSCLGYRDQHDDGVFKEDVSLWKNAFSNQTALFRTSDGGMARINEFRRVGQKGGRSVRCSIYGTEGSFEEQSNGGIWVDRAGKMEEIESSLLKCEKINRQRDQEKHLQNVDKELVSDFVGASYAKVHDLTRLPPVYQSQPNGHHGSHQFLADDFITSAVSGRLPPNNVWAAARYNVPGIIAHQSALRDGEMMKIPDFGEPPADKQSSEFAVPHSEQESQPVNV